MVIRRMPLAEATDDETAIRSPGVKPWQHAAARALEPSLEIARTVQDLRRVRDGPGALWGRRLEPRLSGTFIGERRAGKQRETCDSAKADARAVGAG
jgi:hypothetical protein